MPKISVIIPCYNQGAYLEEAVGSVLAQTFQDFEILVVDDGSTDEATIKMLKDYAKPKTRVIHTDNQGLSMARNNGIREARGDYILPLDADDKIGPGYLEEAVRILDQHQDIGIVYCEAAYFGARTSHWHLPDYSTDQLLFQNLIFCSAMFRREHWEKVGGYNINMIYGWEDWDFWLSLIHLGVKVYRIPRVHFFYRLRETSMIQAMDGGKQFFMRLHAILNHRDLYQRMAEINIRARVTELFFNTGTGFTPHQVIRQVIFGEERTLAFDLSPYGNVRQLRFHPINAPAALHLERVEVTDGEGRCRTVACIQSNALRVKGNHWIFQDRHPWIILDLDNIASAQKLSIRLQYLAIDHEVYPEIIRLNEQEIQEKNKTIRDMLHSTSWKLTAPLRRLMDVATIRHAFVALKRGMVVFFHAIRLSRWIFRVRTPLQFLRQYFQIKRSVLFDPAYYLEQNPDLPRKGMDLLAHYVARGVKEGRDPNPLFDTSYYLERYPDVAELGLNPLAHYIRFGARDGRNPHLLFDTAYYMMQTPELGVTGQDPLVHFLTEGAWQGKKPNSLFITDYYLKVNADVAASGRNPLVHYIEYGFREGRNPNPFFDTAYYRNQNPDVAVADLNPLAHYLEAGAREGRKPHPFFDTAYYLKTNATVPEHGINPLAHYLEYGVSEGHYPYNFYEEWMQGHRLTQPDIGRIASDIRGMAYRPVFSVIIPVYNTEERWLRRCLDSVLAQLYPCWELCIADDASTEPHIRDLLNEYMARDSRVRVVFRQENAHISVSSNSALELARGEFVALLDHDDELAIDALYENAVLLNSQPDADMIYSDEDKITDENLRHMPLFKPDWSPDTFLSQMYSGHLGVYRTELIRKIGGFRVGFEGSQDYDLVLRFTEQTSRIYHIPKILYHWRTIQGSTARSPDSKDYAYLAAREAIQEALDRRGEGGGVELVSHYPGQYRVHYPVQGKPLISVIIPTRDNGPYLDKCLASIFEKTTYEPFEVVILDNGSSQAETMALFDRWKSAEEDRIRIIRMDMPFNYALLNNEGVRQARGDLVCLLNDDTEVITPNWLEELAGQAQRKSVGAVGAFLLYPNSTIQHAGVILGVSGLANHSHRHWPSSWVGYFGRLLITANYAAVTGACLMVGKKRYLDTGGLDEDLAVAYNDVDFCLRLLKNGFRNVVLSHVRLYHDESRSRGSDMEVDHQGRFAREMQIIWKRWGDILANDPYYSPNLTRNLEDFSLVTDRSAATRSDLIRALFP